MSSVAQMCYVDLPTALHGISDLEKRTLVLRLISPDWNFQTVAAWVSGLLGETCAVVVFIVPECSRIQKFPNIHFHRAILVFQTRGLATATLTQHNLKTSRAFFLYRWQPHPDLRLAASGDTAQMLSGGSVVAMHPFGPPDTLNPAGSVAPSCCGRFREPSVCRCLPNVTPGDQHIQSEEDPLATGNS